MTIRVIGGSSETPDWGDAWKTAIFGSPQRLSFSDPLHFALSGSAPSSPPNRLQVVGIWSPSHWRTVWRSDS